jgi:hypothetical protein
LWPHPSGIIGARLGELINFPVVRSSSDDASLPKTATKRKYYGRCAAQRSAINFAYSAIVRAGGNGQHNLDAGTRTRNTMLNNKSTAIASVATTICTSGLLSIAFQFNGRRGFSCTRGIMYKRAPPVAFQVNGRRGSLMLLFHQFDHANIQSDREFASSCVRGSSKITNHH